jgi:2-methylfumaryl-CoA hydratase
MTVSTTAPWFEDFTVGDEWNDVPAVTLTDGHAALHQAMFGDRLRLPLDQVLSRSVTGDARPLVNPALVCNMVIGQSTLPSQRVMGNLFYRGLLMRIPVFVGDTLTTVTRVVALRQNRARAGRPASGMVALEIQVRNQTGASVMRFWRCPMIPCRDPEAVTGRNDDFDLMPEDLGIDAITDAIPAWDLSPFNRFPAVAPGTTIAVEARDTVTLAPELVRLTMNMAMTHTDASRSVYGKRLVYGGHTIAMAGAQLSRALPRLVTVLGWFKCDHVAPVFEEDILYSTVSLDECIATAKGIVGIVKVETRADRGREAPEAGQHIKVLDWQVAVLLGGTS